jgi:hypothetical protein
MLPKRDSVTERSRDENCKRSNENRQDALVDTNYSTTIFSIRRKRLLVRLAEVKANVEFFFEKLGAAVGVH